VPKQLPQYLIQAGVCNRRWSEKPSRPTKLLLPSVMMAWEERLRERITPEALKQREEARML